MKKKYLLYGVSVIGVVLVALLWKFVWAVVLAVALALGFVIHKS